jgi:hypothetical protein
MKGDFGVPIRYDSDAPFPGAALKVCADRLHDRDHLEDNCPATALMSPSSIVSFHGPSSLHVFEQFKPLPGTWSYDSNPIAATAV